MCSGNKALAPTHPDGYVETSQEVIGVVLCGPCRPIRPG